MRVSAFTPRLVLFVSLCAQLRCALSASCPPRLASLAVMSCPSGPIKHTFLLKLLLVMVFCLSNKVTNINMFNDLRTTKVDKFTG